MILKNIDAKGINEEGAGYWHFPIERDAEWFTQLTSEIARTKYVKRQTSSTVDTAPRRCKTEALDCRVYAFAAYAVLFVTGNLI